MSVRHVARTIAISSAALACAGVSALAFSGVAGATSGDSIVQAIPTTTYTVGAPFASGQTVEVKVPANTLFASTADQSANIQIAECSAPNGVLPTLATQCDIESAYPFSLNPNTDGSIDVTNYQIYTLPNSFTLGENSGLVHCGATAATECVLYVGTNVSNPTGSDHYWSAPFLVSARADDGGENPGDGTPEVPLAIGLPLAGAAVFGGVTLRRRRRAGAKAS